MGLIFKRNIPGGKIAFTKRVASDKISKKYIGEVAKKIGSKFSIEKSGARKRFENEIIKAREGGLTREEVHEIIQKGVITRDISSERARQVAQELGLTEGNLKKFKKSDRYAGSQEKPEIKKERLAVSHAEKNSPAQKKQLSEKASDLAIKIYKRSPGHSSINLSIQKELSSETKKENQKPKSVWEILNRQKHNHSQNDAQNGKEV